MAQPVGTDPLSPESSTSITSKEEPGVALPGSGVMTGSGTEKQSENSDPKSRLLDFLATASNETLGACAAVLAVGTYLVFGRVALVLIGALGGFVLHAAWEDIILGAGSGPTRSQGNRRHKEAGLEVAKRMLEWNSVKAQEPELSTEDSVTGVTDLSGFKPKTGAALAEFTDAVIRDYVKWWYSPIVPFDNSFPKACRQTLTSFILSFSNRVSRKRPADTFLDFLTNSSSIVIVFLNELSAALTSPQNLNSPPGDVVKRYLQEAPESSLANVLSKEQQERKLALVADDILHNFLESNAYACGPAKVFLQQILANVVLEMTIRNCSKPEFINGWIVYLLEAGEPEFLEVIDAGVEDMKGAAKTNADAARPAKLATNSVDLEDQKRVSHAQDAMEEAMAEAKRLSDMIAADELRRQQQQRPSSDMGESTSTATTEGMATPTSVDSDHNGTGERSLPSSTTLGQAMSPTDPTPSTPPGPMSPRDSPSVTTPGPNSTRMSSQFSPPPVEQHVRTTASLHNASVTIYDDATPEDKTTFRAKPSNDYLLQIEPTSSRYPGWMISRKYADFEVLHEVLRRISVIAGVSGFTEKHATLPTWKGQTKNYLRQNLERYLQHALQFEPLAECEGMRKFLEKETTLGAGLASKNPFGFIKGPVALENVGKGFVDVLGTANKGIQGGGKAVLGSVQGVFGAVGGIGAQRKSSHMPSRSVKSASVTSLPRMDSYNERSSYEKAPTVSSTSDSPKPPRPQRVERTNSTTSNSNPSSVIPEFLPEGINLPPPPSSIEDDYGISRPAPHQVTSPPPKESGESQRTVPSQNDDETPSIQSKEQSHVANNNGFKPITEEETRVAVELFFAIINELYSLSSAWNIRLTLLSAAKTFLLRPGNPQLESIRILIQESVLDANFTSDEGIAKQILKVRENALPTEEELKAWPPEPSAEEKEKLRVKARKLLVERGMPQALTSVMGLAASGEALGRVFDCLQIEEVSRGLMFALVLQAIRATTQ